MTVQLYTRFVITVLLPFNNPNNPNSPNSPNSPNNPNKVIRSKNYDQLQEFEVWDIPKYLSFEDTPFETPRF